MKILAVGDIVGENAVRGLRPAIAALTRKYAPDMTVANGENAADIKGLTPPLAADIFAAGADVITSGNHILDRRVMLDNLDSQERVLRPANYPSDIPGVGYCIVPVSGIRVLVLNLSGVSFMGMENISSPFAAAETVLASESARGSYDFAVVDMHAEATGEKLALARFLDSRREFRVAAVWGTHTHIPTSDVRILPGGTGYVTDLGMTGPQNGILGVCAESVISWMKDGERVRFTPADGETVLEGVLFEIDADSAKTVRALRVRV